MWFSNSAKVKFLAYHTKKTMVVIIYKKNLAQIITTIAENTKNSSNSAFNRIENIKLKIVRNSHLL